jgi:tRNA A37 threonylcarbamoyladenosine dehydratase
VDAGGYRRATPAVITGDPLLCQHGCGATTGPRDDARRKKFQVLAVYSDEPLQRPAIERRPGEVSGGLACAGYGSSVAVTATMGFVAASAALTRLASAANVRA